MADAQDLKSWDYKKSCGFKSRHRHQTNKYLSTCPTSVNIRYMLNFIEQKFLYRLDCLQSHKLAHWVRRAQRRNLMIAIIIGFIFATLVVAIMLFQNRGPL